MTKSSSLLAHYPSPSRGLVFQCPLCKELSLLEAFTTSREGIAVCCSECSSIFAYKASVDSLADLETKAASSSEILQESATMRRSFKASRASRDSLLAEERTSEHESKADHSHAHSSSDKLARASSAAQVVSSSDEKPHRCPKCLHHCAQELESCPHCGLVFANIGVTFVPTPSKDPDSPKAKGALSLWSELEDDWGNESLHSRFVQYCVANELFDLVTTQYREVKEMKPERKKKAEAQLATIVEHVQRHFLVLQKEDETLTSKTGSWRFILTLILLGFGLVVSFILWQQIIRQ